MVEPAEAGVRIERAETPEQLEAAKRLVGEYVDHLEALFGGEPNPEMRRRFEEEMQAFGEYYGGSDGVVLLAVRGEEPVGLVALRCLEDRAGEARRLFVRSEARGLGAGRALMERLAEEARLLGYERLRLVTMESFDVAPHLYRRLGYRPVPPFRETTAECVLFMELDLRDGSALPE